MASTSQTPETARIAPLYCTGCGSDISNQATDRRSLQSDARLIIPIEHRWNGLLHLHEAAYRTQLLVGIRNKDLLQAVGSTAKTSCPLHKSLHDFNCSGSRLGQPKSLAVLVAASRTERVSKIATSFLVRSERGSIAVPQIIEADDGTQRWYLDIPDVLMLIGRSSNIFAAGNIQASDKTLALAHQV